MFKDHNLNKEELISLNIFQENTNNITFEEDYSIFETFNLDSLFDNYKEKKNKIEKKNFSLNTNKKNEIDFVNNMEQLIYSKNSLNNNKLLFLIKKDKNKKNNKKINKSLIINDETKDEMKKNKLISNKEKKEKIYRKDYYLKHFKAIFGKYLKNKLNNLKNRCFPNFIFNNFSTPNYYFIGNPKLIDNYYFLSWTIREILIFKKSEEKHNRQFNNMLLIDYIEKNEKKTKDKEAYNKLINYINNKLENAFLDFYENKIEFQKICKDEDCIFFDKFFKRETGFSLLEKNGFLKVVQSYKK